jgi:hypothetical protein
MSVSKPISKTSLTGAAGEYFVLYKLLRRGILAGLPPVGAPDVDILVIDESANVLISLQVKTRRKGADKGWHMKEKHEQLASPRLIYVFVDMEPEEPVCYVVPSAVVAQCITRENQAWLATPGKNGQPHNESVMRRLLPKFPYRVEGFDDGWLEKYRESWEQLEGVE